MTILKDITFNMGMDTFLTAADSARFKLEKVLNFEYVHKINKVWNFASE